MTRHRWFKGTVVSLATLAVGIAALVGADYGIPIWVQLLLWLWLLSWGLPTTLTVLLLAALWGRVEPLYGLGRFEIITLLVAPLTHVLVMERVRRWRKGETLAQEEPRLSSPGA